MKNNSKIFIIIFFYYFLTFQSKIFANDIIFNASELNITNNGNEISSGVGSITSIDDDIKIEAQSFKYNKISSILNSTNGYALLLKNNIKIKANKFIYNKKLSLIRAIGDVEVNDLTKNIIIKSEDIIYQREKELIKSNTKSAFVDKIGNNITTDKFDYSLNDGLMKIFNAKIISVENDILFIEKGFLNLSSSKLIGKDISIDFNNKNFNKNNEPRLRGKTISANKNKTTIKRGIFTICKKNDDCPPWQFSAKEIRHDKKKQTINYEKAWLKIYDKPVFYFPKFFHPDPTVTRQSGFLMPSFVSSNSAGTAFSLPYYHVISNNQDLTIRPRFYTHNKLLTQTEYRAVNAKSRHTVDLSILNEKDYSTKNHFFLNSSGELDYNNFDDTQLSVQLQHVSKNTYLKKYKLNSPLIKSNSTLTSLINFNTTREDLSIDVDFIAYENLGEVRNSDKYEFVYPSYSLQKELGTDLKMPGAFNLSSNGYIKNYNTNIFEKVVINDFLYSSFPSFTSNGFKNNFNILIKNINTDSTNSTKYKESLDTKIATLVEYNSSYPLEKRTDNYKNVLKPIMSIRYSPNNSKNMRGENRRIDVNNIFSFNRIGSNDSVEGGGSFSFGTEFTKIDLNNKEIINAKIANVFRLKEDKNMSLNSTLGKKTSDIVGNIEFDPNEFFKISYEFSQDENLKDTNYELLKNEFKINNFITTFEYFNENNTLEKQSYLSNKTSYNLSETKSLIFETRENKKTKATEFHNLIYEYRNDCLTAGIEYNRDYYTDRDLKPDESIFFKLTIIPFGGAKSPNLKY